ncbi:MAG: hypothetical protein RL748_1596, partial [Pseudomonadota bacterium]
MQASKHPSPLSAPQMAAPEIVLRGLHNPRGLRLMDDGSLLLVEAGSGDAQAPFSGRLLRFDAGVLDTAVTGATAADYANWQAPIVVADGFRSMNMQARMCRDEIFGLADVACGGGRWLLSQTDYVDGSRIHDLSTHPPTPLFLSRGNLNALCYHPARHSWLTVKPDTNQVIEFIEGQPEAVVGVLPPLAGGQQCVPVTLVCEPDSNDVLISLFTGELQRDPAKTGIEFEHGVGQVVRLDLNSGQITPVVQGLTLPTGIAFTDQGQLLVLELCDDFLEP